MGIQTKEQMINNSRLGALWEGFALEEIVR